MIKLDYDLQTPQERLALVNKILEETPNPTSDYLETLADYLIFCMEKQEKKEKKILTENRLATINKRETSYENLASKFENGEDGIYNIVNEDKHVIFQPKISITKKDREEIPELSQTDAAIALWSKISKEAQGRDAYIAKKALIEARKDQYVIKQSRNPPVHASHIIRSEHYTKFDGENWVDKDGNVQGWGIVLTDPTVCAIILQNYSKLRERAWADFESDTWYLMEEFDNTSGAALADKPILYRITELKIDGKPNSAIRDALQLEFGVLHSVEYISSLWRNKIPALIADEAKREFLEWHFTYVEKGKYKRCSRCGKIKLANSMYFTKNKTSKDGFYSICKECRNARKKSAPIFKEELGKDKLISPSEDDYQ